jgi:hypothetical protein
MLISMDVLLTGQAGRLHILELTGLIVKEAHNASSETKPLASKHHTSCVSTPTPPGEHKIKYTTTELPSCAPLSVALLRH